MSDKVRDILKKSVIFAGLSEDDLDILIFRMKRREYEKDVCIFSEGEPGSEMFIIAEGAVAISIKLADNTEDVLVKIEKGNFFGEMAIIDNEPRSATCVAVEKSVLFSLSAADLYDLMESYPEISVKIFKNMLKINTARLNNTGMLVADMVRWGEDAKKRAITDEFTSLFNRRFLDESLKNYFNDARLNGKELSLAMVDLDHFGQINKKYGEAFGDRVILKAAEIFKSGYRENDILVRYGGDEFTFILPDTDPRTAFSLCSAVCRTLSSRYFGEHPEFRLTASMGVASFPADADSLEELKEKADQALYKAKESGRNRTSLVGTDPEIYLNPFSNAPKKRDVSIGRKKKIVEGILDEIEKNNSFILLGHKNPDEDCIASLSAMGLLLKKLNKKVSIMLYGEVPEQISYIVTICKYNNIDVINSYKKEIETPDAFFILDTPKPEMIDADDQILDLFFLPKIRKMEIDHHIGGDATAAGEIDLTLAFPASSTCEIIGYLMQKLSKRENIIKKYDADIYSRNIVLSIVTGIVGDSKLQPDIMKTKKEKKFYDYFLSKFDDLLIEETKKKGSNISSKYEILDIMQHFLKSEQEVYNELIENIAESNKIKYLLLTEEKSEYFFNKFGKDFTLSVIKSMVDKLAEENGTISFASYYEKTDHGILMQFKLRKAYKYSKFDVREVLPKMRITDGGGHFGAIGFRIPKEKAGDPQEYIKKLISVLTDMINRIK